MIIIAKAIKLDGADVTPSQRLGIDEQTFMRAYLVVELIPHFTLKPYVIRRSRCTEPPEKPLSWDELNLHIQTTLMALAGL